MAWFEWLSRRLPLCTALYVYFPHGTNICVTHKQTVVPRLYFVSVYLFSDTWILYKTYSTYLPATTSGRIGWRRSRIEASAGTRCRWCAWIRRWRCVACARRAARRPSGGWRLLVPPPAGCAPGGRLCEWRSGRAALMPYRHLMTINSWW